LVSFFFTHFFYFKSFSNLRNSFYVRNFVDFLDFIFFTRIKRTFLFATGIEPVPHKEQILSLPCLPIPPSELFLETKLIQQILLKAITFLRIFSPTDRLFFKKNRKFLVRKFQKYLFFKETFFYVSLAGLEPTTLSL
jgi:hypothetical protein